MKLLESNATEVSLLHSVWYDCEESEDCHTIKEKLQYDCDQFDFINCRRKAYDKSKA